MSVIAIIGAGELGGTLAYTLARRDGVGEIRLIDEAADVAAGKALDIQQAGPLEGFRTSLRASGAHTAAAGAAVIVLADRVRLKPPLDSAPGAPAAGPDAPSAFEGDSGVALLRRVGELDDRAVIVCAGAAGRDLVERGVREAGIDRRRLVGSAPAALVSALRALVALEARASARDVSVSVLGVPPAHFVVPWSGAAIAGAKLTAAVTPAAIARLNARLPRLWPPGPYTLASAAADVVDAAIGTSNRHLACFVTLDGELGVRGRATALAVVLGPGGVRHVLTPALDPYERVLFENALATVVD